jgi:hypothetical protein
VLVEGARASQLGVADSANAGSVSQKELAARTIYRPGELLEAMPGLIASQHSGEGKANQFYLRGFNLDHGTDLRTWVDDMPVNQRSHAHGQGWTDLNFLIPELAAASTTARARTRRAKATSPRPAARRSPMPTAGARRAWPASAAGRTATRARCWPIRIDTGGGSLLYALETLHNDGPFTNPTITAS